jgi:putative transposase
MRQLRNQTRGVSGNPGHEHPLVHFPPTVAISCLVNNLRSVSSRRLRTESPNGGYYWQANLL